MMSSASVKAAYGRGANGGPLHSPYNTQSRQMTTVEQIIQHSAQMEGRKQRGAP